MAAAGADMPVLREGYRGGRAGRGSVAYGAGVNAAALLLTGYGNVPAGRAADLIGMLAGIPVSAGFVDKASSRLDRRLLDAGFDEAMQQALAAEPALGADETPVNVVTPEADPGTGEPDGARVVLIVRPPGGKLTWLRALTSRRHETITVILAFFTGFLIADGYGAYQKPGSLAGVQRCCQHYPDTVVMPIPGSPVLAGGGDRVLDIGIITGLRGTRGAGRGVCSGPGRWRVVWSGRGLAV